MRKCIMAIKMMLFLCSSELTDKTQNSIVQRVKASPIPTNGLHYPHKNLNKNALFIIFITSNYHHQQVLTLLHTSFVTYKEPLRNPLLCVCSAQLLTLEPTDQRFWDFIMDTNSPKVAVIHHLQLVFKLIGESKLLS